VTALIRFSSVRYFIRSSWILPGDHRSQALLLGRQVHSSSLSYGISRNERRSAVMAHGSFEVWEAPERPVR